MASGNLERDFTRVLVLAGCCLRFLRMILMVFKGEM